MIEGMISSVQREPQPPPRHFWRRENTDRRTIRGMLACRDCSLYSALLLSDIRWRTVEDMRGPSGSTFERDLSVSGLRFRSATTAVP